MTPILYHTKPSFSITDLQILDGKHLLDEFIKNKRFLISRLLPTQRTKLQFLSLVISRSLPVPMPEYAAASSNVKFAFSQIGISFIQSLQSLSPSGKVAGFGVYKTFAASQNAGSLFKPDPPVFSLALTCDFISHRISCQTHCTFRNSSFHCFLVDLCDGSFSALRQKLLY